MNIVKLLGRDSQVLLCVIGTFRCSWVADRGSFYGTFGAFDVGKHLNLDHFIQELIWFVHDSLQFNSQRHGCLISLGFFQLRVAANENREFLPIHLFMDLREITHHS